MQQTTKTALVTGAAHRIGAEISRKLHSHGLNIIIHYRESQQAAESLASELNTSRQNSAQCLQGDLSDHQAVIALAQQSINCFGRLDVLVNNASSFYPTPVEKASENDWNLLVDSNLKGPFFLSQALSAELQKSAGTIINIVDIHSDKPLRDHSIYSIAKAGVAMMTKTLAKELAPDIRVNGVSPGAILWPEQSMSDADKKEILDNIPLKTLGASSDIAATVEFLVNSAPYITGQIIAVDGGRSLSM